MAGRHARRSVRPRLRRALVAGAAAATAVTCILTTSPAPQPASPARMDLVPAPALHLEAQEPALEKVAPQPLAVVADQRLVKTPVGDVFAEEEPSQCVSLPLQPGSYRISSPYGYRTHPISGTWSLHAGTDYAAPLGTPIHSVADGEVVYTGAGRLGRSSELVIIEHELDGTSFYSWYVHMYPDGVFVEVGDRVRAGQVIAEVGNNGNSTGPHLHLEIHTADPGLGLTKTRSLTPASFVVPTPEPEPSNEPSPQPSEEQTEPEPATPEPTTPTPTPEPSEEPTEPAPEQTEPEPAPSPEPTESPEPEPTAAPVAPTPEPEPEPDETPSPTPSPSPSSVPDPAPAEDDHRPRTTFPQRAYGTTVDAAHFFASLGLEMVAPSQCR